MDTLPSGDPQVGGFRSALACFRLSLSCPFRLLHTSHLSGPRGITPAFEYGTPHPSARGTSTLLSDALLSAHYGAVRLLCNVPARCTAICLFGPVSILVGARGSRGLPVLVHVVSQRARVLRLRRASWPLAIFMQSAVLPSPLGIGSASLITSFRSSIARPTDTLVYASAETSQSPPQDSGPGWSRFLLSCRDPSSPTTCRFTPAHPRTILKSPR